MPRAILLDENGCKPCSRCKEVKHFSLFYPYKSASGLSSACRACRAAYDRPYIAAWNAKNASLKNAQQNARRRAEPEARRKHRNPRLQKLEAKRAMEKTTNAYVRAQLHVRKGEHPQEDLLIAMKREAISLKRATRAAKTQLKETP